MSSSTLIAAPRESRARGPIHICLTKESDRIILTVCGTAAPMEVDRATLRIAEATQEMLRAAEQDSAERYMLEVDLPFAQLHVFPLGARLEFPGGQPPAHLAGLLRSAAQRVLIES